MKRIARKMLQSLVGLPTYLYYFALYKTKAISKDPHEKHIFLFRDLIPESSLILDVGANLGFVSYHLAQKKGCQIMSFEPIPVNLQVLRRLVTNKRLTNITICDYALGNQSGQATMLLPSKKGSLMSGLSRVLTTQTPGQSAPVSANPEQQQANNPHDPLQWPGQRYTVPLKRLDDLAELSGGAAKIGGIKIDAEGYEFFVLEGGQAMIRQHQPIILVELWNNSNRQRSLSLLTDLGYTVFTATPAGLVRLEPADWQTDHMDFICLTQPELIASSGALV